MEVEMKVDSNYFQKLLEIRSRNLEDEMTNERSQFVMQRVNENETKWE